LDKWKGDMVTSQKLDKPRDNEKRVGETSLKNVLKSDRFLTIPMPFVFCDYGDYLKGVLLSKHSNVDIHRSNSYKIKAFEGRQAGADFESEEGQVEEFFANMRTQRIIDQHKLIGSSIRIVLVGQQKVKFHGGHAAKVYDIFEDKDTQEILQNEQRPKKPKAGRDR